MAIVLTLIGVFILLSFNEIWWRTHKTRNEFARKIVHILVGVWAAVWPFYLSFLTIKYLAAAFLIVVLVSKRLNIFRSIHKVERISWGEVCFALSIGALAFLTHNKWLYAACLMQMALADGLAAIIGVAYGKSSRYKVFGYTKSLVGSLVFFITSLAILVVLKETGHAALSVVYLALTSLVATAIENVGVKGLDNLFVPIVVLLMLHH